MPPRPSSVVPRPQASLSAAVPVSAFVKPAPKAAPSGPRVRPARDFDSESRVVAVRSMQPTLSGIGPDDEVQGSEASVREPDPTICELDERFLVEERSGTLIDTYEAAPASVPSPISVQAAPISIQAAPQSRPSVAAPHLRMVPNLSPAIQPSPHSDPMPRTSHVPGPAPHARIVTPVPAMMPVTQFVSPAPSVAPPPAACTPSPRVSLSDPSRASLSDPMDVLFDAAYDLCFLQTAVEGAHHCMTSAFRAVGGRAALVHLLDVHTGEFVTVAALGDGADAQILARHEDDDWLLSAAVFKGKPITMEYGGEVSSRPLPRHSSLGSPTNVVVVPVIGWGRALAVLEIVDASEAMLAGGRGENALAYLAQRFAEFLGEREIVLAPAVGQLGANV